ARPYFSTTRNPGSPHDCRSVRALARMFHHLARRRAKRRARCPDRQRRTGAPWRVTTRPAPFLWNSCAWCRRGPPAGSSSLRLDRVALRPATSSEEKRSGRRVPVSLHPPFVVLKRRHRCSGLELDRSLDTAEQTGDPDMVARVRLRKTVRAAAIDRTEVLV